MSLPIPTNQIGFSDTEDSDHVAGEIHIRIQQRSAHKTVTTVAGLPERLDFNRFVTTLKKELSCSGALLKDETGATVVRFTGDQRQKIAEFLVREKIAKKTQIKLHGA